MFLRFPGMHAKEYYFIPIWWVAYGLPLAMFGLGLLSRRFRQAVAAPWRSAKYGVPVALSLAFLLFSLYSYAYSKKMKIGQLPRVGWNERFAALKDGLPVMGFPVVIIGGIYSGIFSPTEASAAAVAVPVAVILGILAALYRNSLFDRAISMVTLSTISFPEFFVAYILIALLSVQIVIFPSISNINEQMSFGQKIYSIILPCLTLTLVVVAHMMRQTRAAIINILASPFIEMARLKGIQRTRVIVMHAFPNALSPVINVIALNLAYLVVGVVIVEVVFVYPGLGQLMVDSVSKRDIPVVQACGLIFASVYIGLNLTADVLSIISNPRLRNPR